MEFSSSCQVDGLPLLRAGSPRAVCCNLAGRTVVAASLRGFRLADLLHAVVSLSLMAAATAYVRMSHGIHYGLSWVDKSHLWVFVTAGDFGSEYRNGFNH